MNTHEYKNRTIGIWGLAVVGQAAVRFFHARGARILCMDAQQPSDELRAFLSEHNAQFFTQDEQQQFFALADAVLASPGIDRSRCASAHVHWLSELDLFAQQWHKPIVAITGSVGKTSVTTLVASSLRACGKRVAVGGNIGISVLDLLEQQDACDYAVIEVSSFQLEQCQEFAPDLALWTTFGSNHLDRHCTMEHYFAAKFQIMTRQQAHQRAIVSPDIQSYLSQVAYQGQLLWYASDGVNLPSDGYYLTAEHVMLKRGNTNTPIYPRTQMPDSSYVSNWLLVIAALDQLGLPLPDLRSYPIELPAHRLEYVGQVRGATFYNDSKSTTLSSTAAALERCAHEPVVLFIGGTSKGVDRREAIAQFAHRCRRIYCFGAEAQQLASCVNACPVVACATLQEALDHYSEHALTAGDCVLFSPSGASFDLYRNYQERGNHFKSLIAQMAGYTSNTNS